MLTPQDIQNKELTKANRRKFIARIATNNCDAVIVPHSFFDKMKMSAEYQTKFINEQQMQLAKEKKDRGGRGASTKAIERSITQLKEDIKKLEDRAKRDINIDFDRLGCDMLLVDEQSHTLLALICNDFLGRKSLVADRKLGHINLTTTLFNKLGETVYMTC